MQIQKHRYFFQVLSFCLLTTSGGLAIAQPAENSLNGALPTQLSYTSPLNEYQAYVDEPVQSWREANDRVGRIGGWRAYAKEIRTGKPAGDDDAMDSAPHGEHQEGAVP